MSFDPRIPPRPPPTSTPSDGRIRPRYKLIASSAGNFPHGSIVELTSGGTKSLYEVVHPWWRRLLHFLTRGKYNCMDIPLPLRQCKGMS